MSQLPQRQAADNVVFDCIAEALAGNGYISLPAVLPAALTDELFMHLKSLGSCEFRQAGIGKANSHQVDTFVRGDAITWLDDTTEASRAYLDWMEQLRLELNRRLFLGLFDFECHYAWYPRGTYYKKHVDAFRGSGSNRVISSVLYLNPGWRPGDGGELVLYSAHDQTTALESIEPRYGKLVLFLSEAFPHEVLPANRSRYSVAGWFRVNNSLGPVIDPPR